MRNPTTNDIAQAVSREVENHFWLLLEALFSQIKQLAGQHAKVEALKAPQKSRNRCWQSLDRRAASLEHQVSGLVEAICTVDKAHRKAVGGES